MSSGIFAAPAGVFTCLDGHHSVLGGERGGVFAPMRGGAAPLALPGGTLGYAARGPRRCDGARTLTAHPGSMPGIWYVSLGAASPKAPPEIVDPGMTDDPDDVPEAEVSKGTLLTALRQSRGFVAVPSYDMREYVKQQMTTVALGFGLGVAIGATLGNIFVDRKK